MMHQKIGLRKAATNTNNVTKAFRGTKSLCFLVLELWVPHAEGRSRTRGGVVEAQLKEPF